MSEGARRSGSGGHGATAGPPEGAPEEVWTRIAEAGISLMRIPTPFAVGRVNCWLIEDEPLTLIDTGPNSGKALDELEQQLGALGRRVEDLELIVLTHQHIDHTGLAQILARRSGAEIAAIDLLAPSLANFPREADADDRQAAELMTRHGIPDEVVTALRSVSASFRGWGASATVTRPLGDGDDLALRERSLNVQLRPGHSPSDTLFWDDSRRILIAGDHLIAHISSNPVLSRPLDGAAERPRALLAYMESMRRTRELPAGTPAPSREARRRTGQAAEPPQVLVLPGHGEPFVDHAELIDTRLHMHERRAERLLGLIGEPRTAHELAQELWGNVAVTQAFLTLSEVIGHMDLLIERRQAVELDDGATIRYQAT